MPRAPLFSRFECFSTGIVHGACIGEELFKQCVGRLQVQLRRLGIECG